MKRIIFAIVALALSASAALAQSQPNPPWFFGYVPTPAQWNALWASKQDFSPGGNPITANLTVTSGFAAGSFAYSDGTLIQATTGITRVGAGQLALALGTITTNLKALSITGTWNAGGVTFDAPLFMNIVNTAFANGSMLADFQLGAVSSFNVSVNAGTAVTVSLPNNSGGSASQFAGFFASPSGINGIGSPTNGASTTYLFAGGVIPMLFSATAGTNVSINQAWELGWSSQATPAYNVANDVALSRDAAGVLDLGNGTFQDKSGKLQLGNMVATAAAPTVAASQIGYGSTTSAASSCGSLAGAAGCMVINVAGTTRNVPFY